MTAESSSRELAMSAAACVRPARPQEADAVRELRLRALLAAPDAFEETYDEVASRPLEDWLSLLDEAARDARHVTLVAQYEAALQGVAFITLDDHLDSAPRGGRASGAHLSGMWVEAPARRLGLALALLEAGERWAAARDARELRLWVNELQRGAVLLYERAGYARTGGVEPLRRGSSITTIELGKPLSR
jgi:GNAT superfamily N-acetyltransferase